MTDARPSRAATMETLRFTAIAVVCNVAAYIGINVFMWAIGSNMRWGWHS